MEDHNAVKKLCNDFLLTIPHVNGNYEIKLDLLRNYFIGALKAAQIIDPKNVLVEDIWSLLKKDKNDCLSDIMNHAITYVFPKET